MERMLDAGYAVFSWDKPGTGKSTGQVDNTPRVYHQRAQIILDAIEVMKKRPISTAGGSGLWGISQGGYVMPLALSQTKDIAFMICVSCAGVAGDDQWAYQLISQMICDGVPQDKDAQLKHLLSELDEARTLKRTKSTCIIGRCFLLCRKWVQIQPLASRYPRLFQKKPGRRMILRLRAGGIRSG